MLLLPEDISRNGFGRAGLMTPRPTVGSIQRMHIVPNNRRRRWYEAIGKVVHLDIAEAAASGDRCELELVINDAVRELRHRFRHTNEIGLLDTHNEDYGFARNLAGLRVFWLPVSAVSVGISWATYFFTGNGLALGVASSLVLVLALLLFFILPGYVRQRADRYAESFFGVLTSMAG